MKTELCLFDRTLNLQRYPKRAQELLQAWDAGDEFIIKHVEEELNLEDNKNILILNDNFGALSCWFSEKHNVTMMTDSFVSQRGTLKNLQRNQCNRVQLISSTEEMPEGFDLVIMQIPKNNRMLAWQLQQLRQSMTAECPIIAVNKAKEIHSSTLEVFEDYLGETKTSLAWKKHRLVFSNANATNPLTIAEAVCWSVDNEDIDLLNYPNVYSGERLDQGARFMLEHIPVDAELRHIIDLGCGNGVLSVKAAQLNPEARITCIDESFMAVESARRNLEVNLGKERQFQFIANNCLDGFKKHSSYLVLCNPPFHQGQAVTDHIAWQMFCDAKHILCKEGKLLVIGNRHLDYDDKLCRLFGEENVTTIASNSKFVILEAVKAEKSK
ncbi:methyltransferase domain-containing protein [Aliivibrio salmonicida]|jgi:16S rRNA (guanine1207-N2)-methyltransferase/23S rRNA (guanine1835-N2)-methyltransferase|uniref:Ribosomal RNA large subunit methyltransferase G n=1 Tax=Aliivibrio salmonicida (strain LFI1238) TaxID=316275 RepID=RLMG_ALISL|nr:methyltransferase [Aliivibrio salmonicida]B6EIC1.1 RecName: Full=Ribosomal RNA large subunit methyltransferase G; AltName: Full=23S rRNA m2G1835 methyltransferase; AltName: Full=rRNA (guanine-N(2)-)-methyltransferase RlmG [Aliivibrio salmonicida LFI1238]AZL84303.1 methyltransferase domain-containing protein [Aliivibrio salmonicida]CAQ78632.1 putative methyltransferase [Aliivibrio salmonicida LFI1238]